MKKFYVSVWNTDISKGIVDSKKKVVLLVLGLKKEYKTVDQNDIDDFLMELNINAKPFDCPWVAADSVAFSSSKDYDISFYFNVDTNTIFMSFVCRNEDAYSKLLKLIEK